MIPAHVKQLLVDVYGSRWGEAYLEWGLFTAGGGGLSIEGKGRAATASPPVDKAVFWTAGLLKPGTARADANVEGLKSFVIDDVGHSVKSRFKPEELALFMPEPTSKPESSPGNEQWQWCFSDTMHEDVVTALRRSLNQRFGWQSHATAMSNLIRLPMGVSGKPGIAHGVTEKGRGRTYTAAEFVVLCGGLTVAVTPTAQVRADLRAPSDAAVEAILKLLPNDGVSPYCDSEPAWFNFCQALHGATGGERLDLWQEWCAQQPQARDVDATWDRQNPLSSGWPTLVMYEDKWGSGGSRGPLAGALFDDGFDPSAIADDPPAIADDLPQGKITNPAAEPPRPWLYGHRLIRGYLSSTVAAGGTGKSSLTMVEAVAMATGKDLLKVGRSRMPRMPLRVLVWNGEDPASELRLRLNAIALHYGLADADLGGRLFMMSGREKPLRLGAGPHHNKDVAWIKAVVAKHRIDIVMIDPFVSSHRVPENDNTAIDGVAKVWSDIAEECACAVDLVHHIRKPASGAGKMDLTVDDARGASALINASRNARVLSPMPESVAKSLGVPNRKLYFAIQHDATKANMVPGMVGENWFKFVSVDMGNGEPFPADGGGPIEADSVGVVEQWTPTNPLAMLPANIARAQGMMAGGVWRMSSMVRKGWIGEPVGEALGLDWKDKDDRRAIDNVVKAWVKGGYLKVVELPDSHREMKEFVEVGNTPEDADF